MFTLTIKNSSPTENLTTDTNSILSLTNCKDVSVDELDQWFSSNQWNEIPKIIHQTWKNRTLRERQIRWRQTWCQQYSDWRYHLWTDDENDLFVKTKFPWFYPTFKQLSPAILRADSVRYLYMLYYGGLYVRYEFL
jgi:mannosyltransferase OCH1-like enzyme